MIIDTLLKLLYIDLCVTIDEKVYDIADAVDPVERQKLVGDYQRLDRLRNLYLDGIEEGWEEFNWQEAYDDGWLSKKDKEWFAEELKDVIDIWGNFKWPSQS